MGKFTADGTATLVVYCYYERRLVTSNAVCETALYADNAHTRCAGFVPLQQVQAVLAFETHASCQGVVAFCRDKTRAASVCNASCYTYVRVSEGKSQVQHVILIVIRFWKNIILLLVLRATTTGVLFSKSMHCCHQPRNRRLRHSDMQCRTC